MCCLKKKKQRRWSSGPCTGVLAHPRGPGTSAPAPWESTGTGSSVQGACPSCPHRDHWRSAGPLSSRPSSPLPPRPWTPLPPSVVCEARPNWSRLPAPPGQGCVCKHHFTLRTVQTSRGFLSFLDRNKHKSPLVSVLRVRLWFPSSLSEMVARASLQSWQLRPGLLGTVLDSCDLWWRDPGWNSDLEKGQLAQSSQRREGRQRLCLLTRVTPLHTHTHTHTLHDLNSWTRFWEMFSVLRYSFLGNQKLLRDTPMHKPTDVTTCFEAPSFERRHLRIQFLLSMPVSRAVQTEWS